MADGDDEEEENIAIELEVLEKFSAHRNIARFFGAYLNVDPIQLWCAPRGTCICVI